MVGRIEGAFYFRIDDDANEYHQFLRTFDLGIIRRILKRKKNRLLFISSSDRFIIVFWHLVKYFDDKIVVPYSH